MNLIDKLMMSTNHPLIVQREVARELALMLRDYKRIIPAHLESLAKAIRWGRYNIDSLTQLAGIFMDDGWLVPSAEPFVGRGMSAVNAYEHGPKAIKLLEEGEPMKIKKSLKEGVCSAMRCQEVAESYDVAHRGFCPRHYAELPEEEKVDGCFDGFSAMETPQTELVAKELEPVAADAEMSIEKLSALTILDCEMAEMFDGLLKDAHEQLKELETKRKKVTKHLVAAKKELDDLFKPAKTALSSMKELLKAKLQEWYDEQEKARAAALAEGNQETVALTPEAETTTSTVVRKEWIVEVVNPDLVPKEFWVIDEVALRAYAESQGWVGVKIAGVEIYQRSKLVMGR